VKRKASSAAKAPTGAFDDPSAPPAERELIAALGSAGPLWRRLTRELRAAHGPLADEWSFSKTFGWTLRLKQPARALVHLTPNRSHFLASFALGEKACAAVRDAGIPAAMLAIIDAAPKYAEGRGVRIPVRTKADLEGVLRLAAIKVATTR
jgi:uncharacterized protein DUF3788